MKKALSFLLLLAVALTFCACGGSTETSEVKALYLNGNWRCTEIPPSMKFNKITMNIAGDDFTYTLKGDKTTDIITGYTESVGSNSLALHADKQQQTDTVTGKVLQEKTFTSAESKIQVVTAKPDGNGGMIAEAGDLQLTFSKTE